jgi:hypothetical protein
MRKLGRRAVKWDSRRLMLSRYLPAAITTPPPVSVDWSDKLTQFGSMLNTELGCCTISGLGHAIQIWTANNGAELTLPDSDILAAYESWCGYNPADPSTDQGGVEESVLDQFRKNGLGGQTLTAYADATPSNLTLVKQGINIFLGSYIGMNVTNQVMNVDAEDPAIPWDTNGDTTSAGGHAVYVVGYDASYFYFISWGQVYKMTKAYWLANVDEAHFLVASDMFGAGGNDPQGLNISQLQADAAAIR